MKILLLDIETTPHLGYFWGLFRQNISLPQLVQPSQMFAVAGKWYGEKRTSFWSVHHNTRQEMLEGIHAMMDEADVIIHYNGKSFDIPNLNKEFWIEGMLPPAPSRHIDLYLVAKKNFRFASNKLQHISTEVGLPGKIQHSGFQLWIDCMNGDDKAWKKMKAYNIRDVVLLEDLYDRMKPWIWNGPNAQLYEEGASCPSCASVELQRRGFAYLTTGKYQRYQCQQCGFWSRGTTRLGGVDRVGVNPG